MGAVPHVCWAGEAAFRTKAGSAKRCAPADGHSEKMTRGLLKATTDRSLTKRGIVILDSLNIIKGYRYELWCVARQAATRYCMVHVDTPVETCRQWNQERQGPKYEEHVMEDLCGRCVACKLAWTIGWAEQSVAWAKQDCLATAVFYLAGALSISDCQAANCL